MTSRTTKLRPRSVAEVRNDKIISGYCRRIKLPRFPRTLMDIIYCYFHSLPFAFNQKKNGHGGNCTFIDVDHIKLEGNAIATVDGIISGYESKLYEFEVVVNHIGYYSYIGFVSAEYVLDASAANSVSCFNNRSLEYGLKVMDDHKFTRCVSQKTGTEAINIPEEKFGRSLFEHGDVFRFQLNFVSKKCNVFVNDVLLFPNFFTDIPMNVMPVVSSSGRTAEYTIRAL